MWTRLAVWGTVGLLPTSFASTCSSSVWAAARPLPQRVPSGANGGHAIAPTPRQWSSDRGRMGGGLCLPGDEGRHDGLFTQRLARDDMVACVYSILMGFLVVNLAVMLLALLGNWCIVRRYHTQQVAEHAQRYESQETDRPRLASMMHSEFNRRRPDVPVILGPRSIGRVGCGSTRVLFSEVAEVRTG